VSAAAFADGVDLSPELTVLIKDESANLEARRQALFWFGQADGPTKALVDLDGSLTGSSLREHYTFVLSQRRDDLAIDKLIDIARKDRDPHTRSQAIFWLGQTGEPKALRFFKDILVR
jgi:hypothetical protein